MLNQNKVKETKQTLIEITVIGKDKKGVLAEITNFIFKNYGNIEKINQNVIRGLFGMQLEASFNRIIKKELKAKIPLIIGSSNILKPIAKKYNIPFYLIDHKDQPEAERQILKLFEEYNIDMVILARYMRILTPNFVWRYPNKIINIHPSLLPAFPGAYAYVQAYERGAKIVGCTAHFVTDELDQGPIICQDAFSVLPSDTLESIKEKGRELEAKALVKAIKLYLEDKLEVYWGRVQVRERFR